MSGPFGPIYRERSSLSPPSVQHLLLPFFPSPLSSLPPFLPSFSFFPLPHLHPDGKKESEPEKGVRGHLPGRTTTRKEKFSLPGGVCILSHQRGVHRLSHQRGVYVLSLVGYVSSPWPVKAGQLPLKAFGWARRAENGERRIENGRRDNAGNGERREEERERKVDRHLISAWCLHTLMYQTSSLLSVIRVRSTHST